MICIGRFYARIFYEIEPAEYNNCLSGASGHG
jgi:hypothetical protein